MLKANTGTSGSSTLPRTTLTQLPVIMCLMLRLGALQIQLPNPYVCVCACVKLCNHEYWLYFSGYFQKIWSYRWDYLVQLILCNKAVKYLCLVCSYQISDYFLLYYCQENDGVIRMDGFLPGIYLNWVMTCVNMSSLSQGSRFPMQKHKHNIKRCLSALTGVSKKTCSCLLCFPFGVEAAEWHGWRLLSRGPSWKLTQQNDLYRWAVIPAAPASPHATSTHTHTHTRT